jgi:hypothetical protein
MAEMVSRLCVGVGRSWRRGSGLRSGVALALGLGALVVGARIRPGPVVRWLARRHPDVLFHLARAAPLVARTIDDSPHPTLPPRLLDALAAPDARATFFVIGERVPGHAELGRRLVAAGHELGTHLLADAPSARLPAARTPAVRRSTRRSLFDCQGGCLNMSWLSRGDPARRAQATGRARTLLQRIRLRGYGNTKRIGITHLKAGSKP